MKKFLTLIVMLTAAFCGPQLHAQKIASGDLRVLRAKEDSLKQLVRNFYADDNPAVRLRTDSQFVRTLVRSLQVRNSFQYPFDSLIGVGHIYAPDSSFRIFTWALNIPGNYQRKRGAIQMRTTDGSLKLLPLRDVTEFTERPEDSVRGRDNWIGAVYYNIIKTEWQGKKFYTLFGLDDYGISTKRKWVEVLTFDGAGQPRFGGNYFDFSKDSVPRRASERFYIAYKKEAAALVNWVEEQNMILYDHLVSETNQPDLPYTLIPDGDSEGFKWENGRWVHINKVFDYKIDMTGADPMLGKPPMGEPLLDGKGNVNEEKLKEKTEKNRKKDQ